MRTGRNYANIARRVIGPGDDGQNFQQFMSDSPWSAGAVFDQIQAEVRQRPELKGGMLTLDESGDKKAGSQSAGVARQYLGRLGKVDMGGNQGHHTYFTLPLFFLLGFCLAKSYPQFFSSCFTNLSLSKGLPVRVTQFFYFFLVDS
jgi:hypothetical protein